MFLRKWPIFKRGIYRHVYQLNLELCDASISKNFTNQKLKNRKVNFCNPTEPHYCKSSVNDTVYSEVFFNQLDKLEVMN